MFVGTKNQKFLTIFSLFFTTFLVAKEAHNLVYTYFLPIGQACVHRIDEVAAGAPHTTHQTHAPTFFSLSLSFQILPVPAERPCPRSSFPSLVR